jgi:hypothetical protein
MKLILSLLLLETANAMLPSDTALMMELVTTTASQLNEMEKLVANSENYTKKMQQYNELLQDKVFQSERIMYLAKDMASKKDLKGMGDLNSAIRNLKVTIDDLKGQMGDIGIIKMDENRIQAYVEEEKKINVMEKDRAEKQVGHTLNAKTQNRANQLSAQNTALILENQIKMHKTQLEILKQIGRTNKLLSTDLENKNLNEIGRIESYGIKGKKKVSK